MKEDLNRFLPLPPAALHIVLVWIVFRNDGCPQKSVSVGDGNALDNLMPARRVCGLWNSRDGRSRISVDEELSGRGRSD
jgi:hypothetical protein